MNSLAGALKDLLLNVRSDARIPRPVAARLSAAVRAGRRNHIDVSPYELIGTLPPFETLPEQARDSLRRMILRDDFWSMRLRRSVWRQTLTRMVRSVAMRASGRHERVRHLAELTEFLFLYWQARVLHMLYRRGLRWQARLESEPTIAAALSVAGVDARTLASAYVRQMPQPFETAGYWHDSSRHTTVGVVVGIDFIVNEDGVWFVESNLNVGLMEDRSRLYETDPFVANLVNFARMSGYTSILFLACNDVPVDDIMARRIEREAATAGIRATVLEDRYTPQQRLSQTFLVPSVEPRTLIVRSKMFHTALDAIFHHKVLSLRALESYARDLDDSELRLPPTGVDSIPQTLPMEGPFPNLVCKFPERDQGQGVVFMKVPSLAKAKAILADERAMNRHSVANVWTKLRYRLKLEDQTSVFQTYIHSPLVDGRRLAIARAQVLATPVGVEFLSAHRIVSNLRVPDSLPEGLVQDATPFIVNYSLDSRHATIPREEEFRVRKAAVAVVRALCRAVESRFQTRLPDQGHPNQPAELGLTEVR
jgi:hypothetical protein